MKVVLTAINAKYIHSNLAVYSLRKYAAKYAEQIELAEYTINNHTDDILQDLYKRKPDVLAISCYIWNIDMVWQIIKEIKKVLPDLHIWLGGPEVSYEVEELFENGADIDGVMIGEGEQTFLEVMEYYNKDRNLQDISGIAYWDKTTKKVVFTTPRLPMPLSEIPFPYDDLAEFKNKIIYYESSRGCPFACSYCLSSIEKGVRLRDISLVKKELALFLDAKIPQVKFIDRTFNCNHQHAMEIWNYIYEHDNGVTNFHFEISADLLTDEELSLLQKMRPGLVQLEIGVQSTNLETIKAINRTMNLDKLSYAVEQVRKGENIHQHLDLIAGLPYEDYNTFQKSFNQVYAWKPDQLQLGFLKVLKGSFMHDQKDEYHIIYKGQPPYEVMVTRWLSYEDVIRLKRVEDMVEVYYNSGQFAHTLSFLLHFYPSPFAFYEMLGEYYEENGLWEEKHSRMSRYQILLDFVKKTCPDIVEPAGELLVYDWYLRENAKSRPAFAKNLEQWKQSYHNFYKDIEEKNRQGTENPLSHYSGYLARQITRMTHVECFSYDLKGLEQDGTIKRKEQHILFDYQKRNPLTKDADTFDMVLN